MEYRLAIKITRRSLSFGCICINSSTCDYIYHIYIYIDLGSTVGQFHITLVKIAAPAFWNRTCDMTIPPAKWRSQMRLEIPPALWESHLRSEDRRCVLKSHLRYENRTCEVKIADAFWNPAAALLESHLRSEGRRCVLKTHLRPSLRRCDSHNAAAERSGTLTTAGFRQ